MKIEFNDPIIFIKKVFGNKENVILGILILILLSNICIFFRTNTLEKNIIDEINTQEQNIQEYINRAIVDMKCEFIIHQ